MISATAQLKPDSILVYGSDKLLAGTRVLVLEQSGFPVISALEASDFEETIASEKIVLLVLCHTLSAEKCADALDRAERRTPSVRTLVLTAGHSRCSQPCHSATLSALDGPRKLVETVRSLIHAVPAE